MFYGREKLAWGILVVIVAFIIAMIAVVAFSENIKPGYVGYIYDRSLSPDDPEAIPGTSVKNKPVYGFVWLNPVTQQIYKYPTTIVSRSWTASRTEGSPGDDSFPAGTIEGKRAQVDTYLSVQPMEVGRIIKAFGGRDFEQIVDKEIFGLMKGIVQQTTQNYSIYDVQAKISEITDKVAEELDTILQETYGVKLIRFQFGTIDLQPEILAQIEKKTSAINEVELAKLDRQKQDELNKKIVDEQKAASEKDALQRKQAADSAAYETKQKADAAAYQLQAEADGRKLAALANLESAKLEKQAELEKQQTYTAEYLANKKLDVMMESVEKINPALKVIVTDSTGNGLEAIPGMKMILDEFK